MSADQQIAVFLGDKILAQAHVSDCEHVEGNWYFPDHALVDRGRYSQSETTTHCPWKGDASYYTYKGDDGDIKDIAWFYPKPKQGAEKVEGRVAFYVGKVPGLRTGDPPI
ncbi:hypothetical protein IAR50_000125 [Cryptococcus sp. DSM 104548]